LTGIKRRWPFDTGQDGKGDCDGDAKAISERRHPVASVRRELSGAVSAFPAAMATLFRAIKDFNKSEPARLH